ncbi:hypothetical protein A3C89_00360 [Candidatus Kaiserbacteria bacterium RIFCSPHIGHO2_02_FULL_50_50]|uniref:GTPase Obg n=1 Tax=Candidatus Kaiserbacteria bacterium RIFCSPHIGHO2_02_FULL_50_50 TaxID=1798492 RepID=A0A1F6DE09_9BACT|nr:MAG: hypothetical protein A3C89_00360 [Candidatus Kaiserbacteria bacterium RIFCSPHIGHO2_02_FULL_50_50]OGG89196.1 MAG: hypothetical protein A3G62_01040 [Candidatus Kaiserbacteria bacterium RIFCSPLOWO2_12_FULL_50_10]
MFIDELKIYAQSGRGGDGVVRWMHYRGNEFGGPAGGDGGRGGDVYLEAVRNLSLLSKYTSDNEFRAGDGQQGQSNNLFGKGGADCVIKLPVGSRVTNLETGEVYTLETEGERIKVLNGGNGGYGNFHFKSATNRSPEEAVPGQAAQKAWFQVELILGVDVGLIGKPNAGKSTLLNTFTNATSAIGAYPFTTLEPHLGELYGYVLADVPGLIEGAAEGKGLGHKFLRHASRAKMLLHLVSLEEENPLEAYRVVHNEIKKYDEALLEKEEWVVLTKTDTRTEEEVSEIMKTIAAATGKRTFAISAPIEEGTKELQDALIQELKSK